MYRILTASKDTYITDKIINNKFRATDANTGHAGTLDLFKLYAESVSGSDTQPIESTRLLIKFDISEVKSMHTNKKIDVGDSSFKAYVKLHDVYGGQTTPTNFKLICFPLSQSFDEGIGQDIVEFKDIDVTNWLTASVSNGSVSPWNLPGAKASGSLGAANIDVIVSGTISGQSTAIALAKEQLFSSGQEDLMIDMTSFVSASAKDLITDHGFCIAYSGSYEKDQKTYFAKRFASRNTANTAYHPKLIIKYNDAIIDNHENFEFDYSGSLYLNNFSRGALANIVSGSAASELTGENCMILKIQSGTFSKSFDVSQVVRGSSRLTGIYSSSFAISSFESVLYSHALSSGSIVFNEIWSNSNETVTYLSASLKIKKNNRYALNFRENRLQVSMINLRSRYKQGEIIKLRVHAQNADREIILKKTPFEMPSEIFPNMFYRVRDFLSGEIIIPFDTKENATKLSADSKGMYYDFYVSSLPRGRAYTFDFLIRQNGFDTVIKDAASKFIVE
jgi:hypothetical protein